MPEAGSGNIWAMVVLLVPLSLLALAGLLGLAAHLETWSTRFLVRLSVRGSSTPESAEDLVAAELAPLLAAAGLDHRID